MIQARVLIYRKMRDKKRAHNQGGFDSLAFCCVPNETPVLLDC